MPETSLVCPECGSEIAPALLKCPRCSRFVHSVELNRLSAEAQQAAVAGDLSAELSSWRRALELLPSDSKQYVAVEQKVQDLSARVEAAPGGAAPAKSSWAKGAAGLGGIGLLAWKFKFFVGLILTKGKLLLIGLTKLSTLLSMFLSLGVYWSLWGWKFALGFIACMYVHEIGHVAVLRRYGIRATAPMFLPGFGAFVRLQQRLANPREDARVGLAGPRWGLVACAAVYAVFLATDAPIWGATAKVSAWVNLFNLIPLWSLDGGRAFASLTRSQRGWAVAAVGATWFLTEESMVGLVALSGIVRIFMKDASNKPDIPVFLEYILLAAALAALSMIPVKVPGIT